jgi:2',3'-cyclic-nucleotide 2'-phosphodiesterase (5'-nucleotidase family)
MIGEVVGHATTRLVRSYNTESLLGGFSCDVLRETSGAEIGFMNAGGLRADLPEGAITLGHVQDAFPFLNTVVVLELTGAQIRRILEQGFTLKRGMVQVSGLVARYDLGRPEGSRLVHLTIGGEPVEDSRAYRVATNSFLAEGGDLYETFTEGKTIEDTGIDIAAAMVDYLKKHPGPVPPPKMGRLVPVEGK